jgi:WD40 repeat protein
VLTGALDGNARLWDAESGQMLKSFEGHASAVLAVTYSLDGRQILTGSYDHTAKVWDADSAHVLQTLQGHSEPIVSVAFSRQGTKLLTGSVDRTARCWDGQTGQELQVYRAPRRVFAAVFSPDGQQVITGNEGFPLKLDGDQSNTVRVWDAGTGVQLRSFRPYGSSAVSVSLSQDGKRVLVGAQGAGFSTDDGRAQLWDINTGGQLRVFEGQGVCNVECLAVTNDGRWHLFGGDDGTAWLWDAATGRETQRFRHNGGRVQAVALSQDGRTVLTGGSDCTARLWEAASGKELMRLEGHRAAVVSVALSPDGRSVLTGSADSTARLWNAATGKEVRRLVEYTGQTEFVSPLCCSVAFSHDGHSILTGQWDNTARLWDTASGKELQRFEGHEDRVVSVAFSSNGDRILTGSWDKSARLWNVMTGTTIRSLKGHAGAVSSVAFSDAGDHILTGSWDQTARLWDAETGAELRNFPGHARSGQSVAFALGGQRAVLAGLDKTAVLWNLKTQQPLCTLVHCGGGTVVMTSDSNYMAPKSALNSVAFGIGNRALPFDQFDLKFNRPDLVLASIGLASAELVSTYRSYYKRRIEKLGFLEERIQGDLNPPEITILAEIPLVTTQQTLSFTVQASDPKYALERIIVDVNGVPTSGVAGISLRSKNVKAWRQEITIELSSGVNTIQVYAMNVRGVESIRETCAIRCDAAARLPDLYLIAVGVSKYDDARYRLTYARKDADDLATFFEANANRFRKVHVTRLLDREATRGNILGAKKLLLQSHVDDEVVVFFAGHGLLNEHLDYYYGTVDLDFEDPSGAGLPYAEIENLLDGIPARKKLLLMDTCHSGEVDKQSAEDASREITTTDSMPDGNVMSRTFRGPQRSHPSPLAAGVSRRLQEEMFAELRRGTGAVVISAAGGAEFALESSRWKNGVFTYAILDGLSAAKADANGDGRIQVSELRDHVMEVVPRTTRGRQTPSARRENLMIDFPVY